MSRQRQHPQFGPRAAVAALVGVLAIAGGAAAGVLLVDRLPGAAPDVSMAQAGEEPEGLLGRPLGRVTAMLGICVVYMGMLAYLADIPGIPRAYIPATVIVMIGVLYLLGVRRIRSLVLGPVVTTLLVWLIMTNFLNVRLP
jgi:hypothetical protein